MFEKALNAVKCEDLLETYETQKTLSNPKKLTFAGVDGYDVYNISSEFESNGEYYIAGRVERREDEISHVRLFRKVSEYTYEATLPEKSFTRLQDPFVTKINGEIILGGVQIDTDPLYDEKIICWRTIFYKGKDVESLGLFAIGPNKMKDIRLGQLNDGKIAIFTRPQGSNSGPGKIGYIKVDTLEDVTEENILRAKIYDTHFVKGEWGGANEIHLLESGLLGVLGHISYKCEQGNLHYHSMAFVFNPDTLEHTPVKIIARRKDFLPGETKEPRLNDVLFTGGMVRKNGQKAILYTGVSDCEAHCVELEDPFKNY